MKKLMILFLTLGLIVAGVFFWKGGHHALFLADKLEEWLEADDSDQSLTVQIQMPDFSVDDTSGRIEPEVRQWSFSADSFWTEYADKRLFGLGAGDVTAYLHGNIVYMDTGRAYALPELSGLTDSLREFALGLLVHGRVTKTEDTYRISMKTQELELSSSLTVDRELKAATLTVVMSDGRTVHASLTPKQTVPHPIPKTVTDAIVRAQMETPMLLTEPLDAMLPALKALMPLNANVKLGVECGILSLSETVALSVSGGKAELERDGILVTLALPEELSDLSPLTGSLLLLRSGRFAREGDSSTFHVTLPGDITSELIGALVPQAADLGIRFDGSEAVLTITGERLTAVSMTASGSVPFLITEIPVSFSAEFDIQ